MPYVLDLIEFAARQRCKPFFVNGRHLFASGAWSDGTMHYEPPEEDFPRLSLQREYYQALIKAKTRDFEALRNDIAEACQNHSIGGGPIPDPGAIAFLKQLRSQILDLRQRLARIEQSLAQTPEGAPHFNNHAAELKARRLDAVRQIQHAVDEIDDI